MVQQHLTEEIFLDRKGAGFMMERTVLTTLADYGSRQTRRRHKGALRWTHKLVQFRA